MDEHDINELPPVEMMEHPPLVALPPERPAVPKDHVPVLDYVEALIEHRVAELRGLFARETTGKGF